MIGFFSVSRQQIDKTRARLAVMSDVMGMIAASLPRGRYSARSKEALAIHAQSLITDYDVAIAELEAQRTRLQRLIVAWGGAK